MHPETRLVAVDVFAGAGGLTVGLKRAGFKVAAAVEIEPHAFATYKANHPDVHALKQDVRTVTGQSLRALVGGRIHVIAGCPPCQGFSTLTNPLTKRDPRNSLVKELARIVREARPTALMMENVPGIVRRGKRLFSSLLRELDDLGYKATWDVLQVADYGVPQNRRRLVLFAGKGFKPTLPPPTHNRLGDSGLKRWRTLRSAIADMQNNPPVLFDEARKKGGAQAFNWHVIRRLSPDNIARLRVTEPGKSRMQLPDELRPECHRGLDKGYYSVYGRMSWNQVPVTITGGCATLSKGRFGHPEQLRTISVREAARIQTFPDEYIFDSQYMDKVCNMVGNALPCDFAEILAACLHAQIQARLWKTGGQRE